MFDFVCAETLTDDEIYAAIEAGTAEFWRVDAAGREWLKCRRAASVIRAVPESMADIPAAAFDDDEFDDEDGDVE